MNNIQLNALMHGFAEKMAGEKNAGFPLWGKFGLGALGAGALGYAVVRDYQWMERVRHAREDVDDNIKLIISEALGVPKSNILNSSTMLDLNKQNSDLTTIPNRIERTFAIFLPDKFMEKSYLESSTIGNVINDIKRYIDDPGSRKWALPER